MNSRRRGNANNAVIHLYTSSEREKDLHARLKATVLSLEKGRGVCRRRRRRRHHHSDVNKPPKDGTADDEGFSFSGSHTL